MDRGELPVIFIDEADACLLEQPVTFDDKGNLGGLIHAKGQRVIYLSATFPTRFKEAAKATLGLDEDCAIKVPSHSDLT